MCIQFMRPDVPNPPVTGDLEAPADVKAVIQRACYDCHSNNTNLRWYDKIVPIYWGWHPISNRAGPTLIFPNGIGSRRPIRKANSGSR
ncbi:heme-binding domain-containing protein [Mucilaginibacter sp. P25]|uniref:heme-binding domain-containing protein n=1 Tax=Mucilaginibacter sp. P25 TaxID=3423945 RepID=UPI003D7967C3